MGIALWGSLAPFAVRAVPLDEALRQLCVGWAIDPRAWSFTDVLSNFLLFVPIGLFGAAVVEDRRGAGSALWAAMTGGVLLSTAIELSQAFVWWRTPSALDVAADALGTGAGVGLWRLARRPLDSSALVVAGRWRQATAVERLLLVYAVAVAGAWLFPFDLTIRPEELADKYLHQRLVLPFVPSPDSASPGELFGALLAAIPLGLGASLCASPPGTRRPTARATALASLYVLALEAAQALVFSRDTDATSVVYAWPGLVLGAAAGRVTRRPIGRPFGQPARPRD